MQFTHLHSWDVSSKEAREIQQQLAPMVDMQDHVGDVVRYVAGLDVSPPDARGVVQGAVVVLSYPDLEIADVAIAEQTPAFPYVPGLLSFRETPVLLEALQSLTIMPDLLILDAQGYAHPRRFGLACHLGLLADIPTIGCAKSLLVGNHNSLGEERGATADLMHKCEVIGVALRSRVGVKPLYISVGHKVDLASAARWVLLLHWLQAAPDYSHGTCRRWWASVAQDAPRRDGNLISRGMFPWMISSNS